MQKEANFVNSVQNYIDAHGYKNLYDTVAPKTKKSIVPATVKLEKVKASVSEYEKDVEKVAKRYGFIENKQALYRYHIWGMLSSISLSVSPKFKKKWGINHELFGSFYNTLPGISYCSLFPDLEEGSVGNVFFFKPKKGDIILANPPYTEDFIKWTCKKVLEWKHICDFYVVIPVWNRATRTELGLSKHKDLPEIGELISQSTSHKVMNLPFYSGLTNKEVELKDSVHVIYFQASE